MHGPALGISERDTVLPIVPMFHANAWGLPYAAWMSGADLVLPARFANAAGICRLIGAARPTVCAGVPTVFRDMLAHGESNDVDLSSLRGVLCGGSAVPEALIDGFEKRYGVQIFQGWGMTETSPVAALAIPPKRGDGRSSVQYRAMTGRVLPGVELRIVDDGGQEQPWDGEAEGEIEVRGPWVTAQLLRRSDAREVPRRLAAHRRRRLHRAVGFIRITDRAKDVIKSGGEWISSVGLENLIMAHPAVAEAAVIGVPDEKWDERPLACVVREAGPDARHAGADRAPRRQDGALVAARALGLHRRGAQDQRRQVRQEGPAQPLRRGQAGRAEHQVILELSSAALLGAGKPSFQELDLPVVVGLVLADVEPLAVVVRRSPGPALVDRKEPLVVALLELGERLFAGLLEDVE